jgi:hypothetical protein
VALLLLVLPACMGIAMIIAVSGAVFSRSPSRRRDGLTALALLTRSKSGLRHVKPPRHRHDGKS